MSPPRKKSGPGKRRPAKPGKAPARARAAVARPDEPEGEASLSEAEPAIEPAIEPVLEPVEEGVAVPLAGPALPVEDAELVQEDAAEAAQARSAALSRTDPLARYMFEVSKHPLLSREEEHELAVKYRETGDLASAYTLVAANLRLVVKIAYEYRRAAFSVLDLIQEGNVGLMHAVKKYDPYKGVKLSSYAAWWIRAYILRFIMDNWRMVKLGTTQAQRKLFFNLRKEQQKLAAEGFDAAGPKLLAERLQVTEQEVVDMDRRLSGDELSIDTPLGEDGPGTYGDRLTQGGIPADEALGNAEIRAVLRRNLDQLARTLEGKERFIFEKRLVADEPMTLQAIGDRFGISRERARQLEARLVSRLRDQMKKDLPDFAELTVEGKE